MTGETPRGALAGETSAAGSLAQFNIYLQLFARLVVASEALAAGQSLYRQLPWSAAGNLDVATEFPNARQGTVIIDQTVAAALDVTLTGTGPWTVVDGAGVASGDNITVKGAGGATINGAATYVISNDYGAATFLLYGSDYLVVSKA